MLFPRTAVVQTLEMAGESQGDTWYRTVCENWNPPSIKLERIFSTARFFTGPFLKSDCHIFDQPLLRIFDPILKNASRELLHGSHTRSVSISTPSNSGIMKFAKKRVSCIGCRTPIRYIFLTHYKPGLQNLDTSMYMICYTSSKLSALHRCGIFSFWFIL